MERVKPRIVVPMHYRGEGFGYEVLGTVKEYTDLCETAVYGDSEVLVLEESDALESDDVSASDQNPVSAQTLSWRTGTQSGTLEKGQEETVVLRMVKDEYGASFWRNGEKVSAGLWWEDMAAMS